jgi:23S rRNA (adenine2503-C2)-methyltransferase
VRSGGEGRLEGTLENYPGQRTVSRPAFPQPPGISMHHILEPGPLLAEWCAEHGQPAWRARAIRRWLHGGRAESFADMSDLPRGLRADLAAAFTVWSTTVARHHRTEDGTEKLLLQLADGERIECVLLRDGQRRTVCISTQVGCAMGCVFCASGLDGVIRNLSAGEILEQVLRLARLLPGDERLSHVVVMGMGEPLANLDRLLPALAAVQEAEGPGISARRITVSTVGLPKAIDRLTAANPGYHLAVSLHAPDDQLRTRLVPVNAAIGLADVMAAADRYWEASGRRLTYEYVLLGGINDSPRQARDLVTLLAGRAALVNVIPYNAVAGLPWKEPTTAAREGFLATLRDAGVNVQVRRRKGARIDAACGQLRRAAAGADSAEPSAASTIVHTIQPTSSTAASTAPRMPPSHPIQ